MIWEVLDKLKTWGVPKSQSLFIIEFEANTLPEVSSHLCSYYQIYNFKNILQCLNLLMLYGQNYWDSIYLLVYAWVKSFYFSAPLFSTRSIFTWFNLNHCVDSKNEKWYSTWSHFNIASLTWVSNKLIVNIWILLAMNEYIVNLTIVENLHGIFSTMNLFINLPTVV